MFEDLKEFEFTLSEERIARYPTANRDESKLMVLDVNAGDIFSESSFKNIVSYLKEGDVLVANHTKVSKRRVYLKTQTRIHETMFLEENELLWKCKIRNSKKLKVGTKLSDEKTQRIAFKVEKKEGEFVFLKPDRTLQEEDFQQIGEIPIPPYLKRNPNSEDEIRYQTLFAKTPGSVAAPTAGLHFSEPVFQTLKEKKSNSARWNSK
ncbi:queuosine biosynthesis domain protein [Leptospira santarosai str. CBC1416]|uniref:Queuosine biosynthesis domain protein n=1 Tax=Leptospira santarosai str. CBC1416 TaxID=1193059 RepID=M6W0F5_9LEPT|nr:queuosine biosynthesis domain protein [Leptospira santarosai str. CBC1416]